MGNRVRSGRPAPNLRSRCSRRRLSGGKGGSSPREPVGCCPFPAWHRERESWRRRLWTRSSRDDQAEILQAPRSRPDGEDGRELHRRAGRAAGGGEAGGGGAAAARPVGRGDPAQDGTRLGGGGRPAGRV